MSYTVYFLPAVERDLRRLKFAPDNLQHVREALISLGNDPRPPGCRKLVEKGGLYCVRRGDYRILYRIDDRRKAVIIEAVERRDQAY